MLNVNVNQTGSGVQENSLQMPPAPPDFTGREKELEELLHQVRQWCVIINAIHGPEGMGKTALALAAAQRLSPDYPGGQFFLNLKGSSDDALKAEDALSLLIHRFLPEAHLPDDLNSLVNLYTTVLTGKNCLLLLDDAAGAEQISPLIPPAGNLLIVTSLSPLILAGMSDLDLTGLLEADAIKLLFKVAPRLGPLVNQVVQVSAGHPLALRLCAGLLREQSGPAADKLIKRLQEGQKHLKSNAPQNALQAAYEQLAPDLQTCLRRLSVFAGSFDTPAAAAVCKLEDAPAAVVLARLAAAGFVQNLNGRYSLHSLVRRFVQPLIKEDENLSAQGRWAAYYARLLAHAAEDCRQGGDLLRRGLNLFDREWENIGAGQAWAAHTQLIDKRAARLMLDYASAGEECLENRLHPRERITWMENGLRAARTLENRRGETDMLHLLGRACAELDEMPRAISYHEKALLIARDTGERRQEGRALFNLGEAFAAQGQSHQAIKYYDLALQVHRESDDRRGECLTLNRLGEIYAGLGEMQRAIVYYETQLEIARKSGDRREEGLALGSLGLAYSDLEESEQAITCFKAQLALTRETGDRRGEGAALGHLGAVYSVLSEIWLAITYFEAQLPIARENGERDTEGTCLEQLGAAYQRLGETGQAVSYYEQALAVKRELNDRHGEGAVLGALGGIYLSLEQSLQAIAYFEQQLVITREIGVRHGEAAVSWNLGLAYAQLQQFEKAAGFMQVRVDYEETIRHSSAQVHAEVVKILRLLK